ncbi:MAG: hypothetical protein FWE38_01730 [Firmicutes bacterium]|nr:hypothetical protein [Bacillota bacterium]
MKRERGSFRTYANAARARLAEGFWQNAKPHENFKSHTDDEDGLYYTVLHLLQNGINAPLTHILDRVYMKTLSDSERERYVFSLSGRVAECVERYRKESA